MRRGGAENRRVVAINDSGSFVPCVCVCVSNVCVFAVQLALCFNFEIQAVKADHTEKETEKECVSERAVKRTLCHWFRE